MSHTDTRAYSLARSQKEEEEEEEEEDTGLPPQSHGLQHEGVLPVVRVRQASGLDLSHSPL